MTSRWSFHPDGPRQLLARMDLGDATRLFAGKGGERWLVHAREGTAEAAPLLADEDLVAITQPDPSTFAFIGSGGSIYVSKTPLGPFVDVRSMEPTPLRVAAAGKSIVALHWDGTVTRSTDAGKTFATVPVGGSRPFDVALSPDGRAVILGFPEQLWLSRDDAATWSQATTPTVGAGFVGMDANGSLVARGLRASVVWSSEPRSVPEVADRALEVPTLDLLTDLEPGPSASALAAGRAVLTGTTYFEVARQQDEGPWYLASGELAKRIRWMPIPQSDECKHMAIGANGRRIVLGCMSGARRGGVLFPSLRVIVSRDAGNTFTPKRPTVLVADEEGVSLTILGDDTLIVSGACKPDTRGICSPGAPMRLVPARESRTLQFESTEPAKLPPIVGRVGRVHVGPGAERLYAKAQLSSGPALLISEDRGESFRAVPLNLSKTAVASKHDVAQLLGHMQPGKLVVARDGTLSWVLYTEPGPIWVLLSDRGKVLSAHLAPEGQSFLEVAGRNGLAFGDDDGALVESSDGGATFQPLTRLPAGMLVSEETPTIWCDLGGCVLGDSFSRVGWGSKDGGILNPKKSGDVAKPAEPAYRTPIVCELIEGAGGEIQNVVDFPDAADAQRGSSAWSALVVDPKTASVHVARATSSPKHAVSLEMLLRPTPNPSRVAMDARSQAEGAAALRYTFAAGADGKPTVGSPLRRIEVAWDNQFEGPVQRSTILSAGTLRPGDVSVRGEGVVAQANVEMLSVAPGGIHVCPHSACDQRGDEILFLRGRGPAQTIPIPPWPERGLGGGELPLSHHVMHVQGKHVPIAIHQNYTIIMRADRHEDGSYAFPALGLAPWNSKELGLGQVTYWSYLASGLMGLSQTVFHATEDLAYAQVLRFDTEQGVAKAVPAPTQKNLSDPPAACSDEQRKGSFRVPSPALRGVQHPVIIDHGRMKELLHTQLAVLYGSPSSACADVMDARSEESTHRRALIPVGAMDRSWLLSRGSSSLQWYGMRCRFQPGAKIEGGSVGTPPPAAPGLAVGGTKRPATVADCEFIFDKIIGFMGVTMPPVALNPARDAFKNSCQGRPVDMDCVRNATDHNRIMNTCLSAP